LYQKREGYSFAAAGKRWPGSEISIRYAPGREKFSLEGNMTHSAAFKTILVGDDGTPEAEQAVEVAISLALSLRAKLIVLGVVGPPSPESEAEGYGLETVTQTREKVKEWLDGKFQASGQSGIEVITEIFEGKADEVIIQRVEQDSVDLVVVGRRDIARMRHWLEGSTSESLVRHCPVSVLVVQ
jgi:nucleotide-binding universal stress UspA family protein